MAYACLRAHILHKSESSWKSHFLRTLWTPFLLAGDKERIVAQYMIDQLHFLSAARVAFFASKHWLLLGLIR